MTEIDIEKIKEVRKKLKIYVNIITDDFVEKDSRLNHILKLLKGLDLEFEEYFNIINK